MIFINNFCLVIGYKIRLGDIFGHTHIKRAENGPDILHKNESD